MKIALVTDTHFGARNDSPLFLEHFMRFFDRVFFPRIEADGIDTIIHLGDFLDRRKFVNFLTLNAVQTGFVKRLEKSGAKMHCILGNHDIFFKNKSEVNSLQELFSDRFIVHDKPTVLTFDGLPIAMLPWINKENEAESLQFLKDAPADIMMGHLELNGYHVLRNTPFDGGMDANLFQRFKAVYTGHFHSRHSRDNIHYLGCPYQITMSDYGEKKGFHIFDTETQDLEFVKNPHTIFTQIRYDDSQSSDTVPLSVDEDRTRSKYVRIIVEKKTKPYLFEKFVDSVYSSSPHGVTIIEDFQQETTTDTATDELGEDTISIINREIDSLKQDIGDCKAIKELIRELYGECMANEIGKP